MKKNQITRGHECALNLLERLENGTFSKNHLTNHSDNFTGGREQLAREAFDTYIGSCGYMLMEIRLNEMENVYYGE